MRGRGGGEGYDEINIEEVRRITRMRVGWGKTIDVHAFLTLHKNLYSLLFLFQGIVLAIRDITSEIH